MKISCAIGIILSVVSVTYGIDTVCVWREQPRYTCILYNGFMKDVNASLSFTPSDHLGGKGNGDVMRVEFADYLTQGSIKPLLSSNFPNLEEIIVENGTIDVLYPNSATFTSDLSTSFSLKLKVIKFSKGKLSQLPPRPFSQCKNLFSLDLSKNKITTIDSAADEGLENLETLILDDNLIPSGSPIFSSTKLTKLKYLSIAGNALSSLPGSMSFKSTLTKIDFSRNDLTTITTSYFTGYNVLEELNLERNKLTTLDNEIFNGLSVFKILNIASNKISTFDFLRKATQLQVLNIASQEPKLTGFFNSSLLSENKELRVFNASDNEITTIYRSLFTNNAAKITFLDMSRNRINKVDWDLISSLTSLTGANFTCNRCISKNFLTKPVDKDFELCNSSATLFATAIIVSIGVILSRIF